MKDDRVKLLLPMISGNLCHTHVHTHTHTCTKTKPILQQ